MIDHYGTVGGADAYHAARGNTTWAGSEEQKTAALVRASQYIDSLGGTVKAGTSCVRTWPGAKTGGRAQSLAWPRQDAYDSEGAAIDPVTVPIEVVTATYEAALIELTDPGSTRPDFIPVAGIKREKVGPLETEFAVSSDAADFQPVFGRVDALLGPVLYCMPVGLAMWTV